MNHYDYHIKNMKDRLSEVRGKAQLTDVQVDLSGMLR